MRCSRFDMIKRIIPVGSKIGQIDQRRSLTLTTISSESEITNKLDNYYYYGVDDVFSRIVSGHLLMCSSQIGSPMGLARAMRLHTHLI